MTTWKNIFKEILEETGDSLDRLKLSVPSAKLDISFDDGLGRSEGTPFVAWSDKYVYFSRDYDGADLIDYVPRHPE